MSPICETSKTPTPLRTALCSAIRPGYSTGISQPPKSTILAFRERWVALRAVLRRGASDISRSPRFMVSRDTQSALVGVHEAGNREVSEEQRKCAVEKKAIMTGRSDVDAVADLRGVDGKGQGEEEKEAAGNLEPKGLGRFFEWSERGLLCGAFRLIHSADRLHHGGERLLGRSARLLRRDHFRAPGRGIRIRGSGCVHRLNGGASGVARACTQDAA